MLTLFPLLREHGHFGTSRHLNYVLLTHKTAAINMLHEPSAITSQQHTDMRIAASEVADITRACIDMLHPVTNGRRCVVQDTWGKQYAPRPFSQLDFLYEIVLCMVVPFPGYRGAAARPRAPVGLVPIYWFGLCLSASVSLCLSVWFLLSYHERACMSIQIWQCTWLADLDCELSDSRCRCLVKRNHLHCSSPLLISSYESAPRLYMIDSI